MPIKNLKLQLLTTHGTRVNKSSGKSGFAIFQLEDQGPHESNLQVDPAHHHREHGYVDFAFLKRFVGSKSMPEKRNFSPVSSGM